MGLPTSTLLQISSKATSYYFKKNIMPLLHPEPNTPSALTNPLAPRKSIHTEHGKRYPKRYPCQEGTLDRRNPAPVDWTNHLPGFKNTIPGGWTPRAGFRKTKKHQQHHPLISEVCSWKSPLFCGEVVDNSPGILDRAGETKAPGLGDHLHLPWWKKTTMPPWCLPNNILHTHTWTKIISRCLSIMCFNICNSCCRLEGITKSVAEFLHRLENLQTKNYAQD